MFVYLPKICKIGGAPCHNTSSTSICPVATCTMRSLSLPCFAAMLSGVSPSLSSTWSAIVAVSRPVHASKKARLCGEYTYMLAMMVPTSPGNHCKLACMMLKCKFVRGMKCDHESSCYETALTSEPLPDVCLAASCVQDAMPKRRTTPGMQNWL